MNQMIMRARRNRKSPAIRRMIQETELTPADFVVPFFVIPGVERREPIAQMPGIYRLTPDLLIKEAEMLHAQGFLSIAIFPCIDPSLRDEEGREAWNTDGLIPLTISQLKKEIPSLCVIADIALDPYTSHGHDGIVNELGEIDNDLTVKALIKQSLVYAEAGCDILAPSDMMDGRIKAIREALDHQSLTNVSLLSYTAKYASSFYGPYRDAIQTKLQFGDKKSYHLNPANIREALREASMDVKEGADMLLIKPALPFLDVISKIKSQTLLPVGAYHVSGEYSMIMAAHERGWLDAQSTFYESLISIKRAGADFIFSYAAPQILDLLN